MGSKLYRIFAVYTTSFKKTTFSMEEFMLPLGHALLSLGLLSEISGIRLKHFHPIHECCFKHTVGLLWTIGLGK